MNNFIYTNNCLGKNGWFYWFLFPMLIGPIAFVIIFFYVSCEPDFLLWERLIFIGGCVFSLKILFDSLSTLKVGADTLKNISIGNKQIEFVTFSEKKHLVNHFSVVKCSADKFGKHYLHFFSSKESQMIIIVSNKKKYYLSINNIEFQKIYSKLLKVIEDNYVTT